MVDACSGVPYQGHGSWLGIIGEEALVARRKFVAEAEALDLRRLLIEGAEEVSSTAPSSSGADGFLDSQGP